MDVDLKTVTFAQLVDLRRALVDIPKALRLLHQHEYLPKVAYDIICVVDPQEPYCLYIAFVRGEVVYETSVESAAASAPAPAKRVRAHL